MFYNKFLILFYSHITQPTHTTMQSNKYFIFAYTESFERIFCGYKSKPEHNQKWGEKS